MKYVNVMKKPIKVKARQVKKREIIKTLEGNMIANKGDWIIIGVDGEKWPVKDEIFRKTYKIIK